MKKIINFSFLILLFCSSSCSKNGSDSPVVNVPVLSTVSVDFYEKRADGPAVLASVTNTGGAPIIQKGVVWSSSPNVTINSENKIISQSGDSAMQESIRGMALNKTYYVKAFATNSKGTSYSNEISFKIPVDITWRDSTGLFIFYIFKEGDPGFVSGEIHGLMTSGAPVIAAGKFSCASSTLNGSSTAIGYGFSNTEKIINQGIECSSPVSIGKSLKNLNTTKFIKYSDWYIPSRDEFLKMREFDYKYKLFMPLPDNEYWTSSEIDATRAYGFNLTTRLPIEKLKSASNLSSIPIRSF
jgi:hypothetical protein